MIVKEFPFSAQLKIICYRSKVCLTSEHRIIEWRVFEIFNKHSSCCTKLFYTSFPKTCLLMLYRTQKNQFLCYSRPDFEFWAHCDPHSLVSSLNCWKRLVDFAENCMTSCDDKTKLYAAKTVEKDLNAKKTKTTFKKSFSKF